MRTLTSESKEGTSSRTVSESQIQDLSLFLLFVNFAFVIVDYVLCVAQAILEPTIQGWPWIYIHHSSYVSQVQRL